VWCVVGVLTVCTRAADGPTNFFSKNWLVDDGLPNNSVKRILLDGRGFMWLATPSGLARFDGRQFKEFPLPMASPEAVFDVRDLWLQDADDLLVLPAIGGVVELRSGKFAVHPASAAMAGKVLLEVFAEPDGTLWLGAGNGDVIRWHAGETQIFGRAEGLTRRNNRYTFVRDVQGRTWVAGGEFLGWYRDGKLVRFPERIGFGVIITPSDSGGLWVSTTDRLLRIEDARLSVARAGVDWQPTERGGVQTMCDDGQGSLWIGTRRQGLYRLSGGELTAVPTPHNTINDILADRDHNVWIATQGGGLARFRAKAFTLLDSTVGLTDDTSTGVCEDPAGGIWVANRAGGFVRVFDGKVERATRPGTTQPYAITVCPDAVGNIWAGATDGIYRLAPGETALELVTREVRETHVLFCARNGDMWAGFGESGLGYFRDGRFVPVTEAEGYSRRRVKAIVEAPDGGIWIATDDRQVFEFSDGKMVCRISRDQMPGGLIFGCHFDADGNLWIATSRGLVLKREDQLDVLLADDGLPDDQLSLVTEDDRGWMWIGSRRGIFCVRRADLLAAADGELPHVTATSFGREDGLSGASALNGMEPQAWKGRDGRVWLATHSGVVGVDPSVTLPEGPAPRVYIDEVLVNRRAVDAARPLRLTAGANELGFTLAVPSFTTPDNIRLRHQLVGYDLGWVEMRGERHASYVRLPAGHYSFRVGAAQAGANWGESDVALDVVVVPAWWQTMWFRAAALLALVAAAGWATRFWSHRRLKVRLQRLERANALERERTRIARDLHDELGGSLTQIGMLADRMSRHATTSEVKHGLGDLATRTRRLAGDLESIVWTVNPGNNTLDRLAAFVSQFAQRFFRGTSVVCTVEGADVMPPLSLTPEAQHNVLAVVKESLNNILKHAHATRVSLTFAQHDGRVELAIVDDGAGFDLTARELGERNGLNNMRARMAEIHGEIAFDAAPGRGTKVVVTLPVSSVPEPVT
jgi:signal transduction histidine kinase/ligand-binding sensor domain-containing protein